MVRTTGSILFGCKMGNPGQAVLLIPTEVRNPATGTLEALLDQYYQEIFLPPAKSETARLQFDMMTQAANETVLQYASKMRCLYLHAYADRESETIVNLIRKFILQHSWPQQKGIGHLCNGKLYPITFNTDNIIIYYLKSGQVYYDSGELQCVGQSILL